MQENEFGVLQLKAFRELKPYFLFEPVIPIVFYFFWLYCLSGILRFPESIVFNGIVDMK